jgi:hypothetical protein
MAAEEAVAEDATILEDGKPDAKGKRDYSTVDFPYGDIDDAVQIAKAVNEVGGSSCEWEQLAAKLGQVSTGGGFRQRMLTAKAFTLITYAQGRVSLTALGSRICDPKQEKAAKAEAFLKVELYRLIYEKFKSTALPPAVGLESEMVTLGVAKKQAGKARQVFGRSAQQAGFFWSGNDRLVMPPTNGSADQRPPKPPEGEEHHDEIPKGGGDGGDGTRHPFIVGLIKTLPAPGVKPWPVEGRRKWLLAACSVFDLIYTTDDEAAFIRVEIQRDSAK